jgi:hypothetical protein
MRRRFCRLLKILLLPRTHLCTDKHYTRYIRVAKLQNTESNTVPIVLTPRPRYKYVYVYILYRVGGTC